MRATMRTMEPGTLEEVRARLQAELDARGGVKRRLAREIAGTDDARKIETARRAIYRVLYEESRPESKTAEMLERALRKPRGYFTVAVEAKGSRRDRLESLEAEARDQRRLIQALEKTVEELAVRIAAVDGQAAPRVPRLSGRQ